MNEGRLEGGCHRLRGGRRPGSIDDQKSAVERLFPALGWGVDEKNWRWTGWIGGRKRWVVGSWLLVVTGCISCILLPLILRY